MEATFNITKFDHDDLVNLFSTATYGNSEAIVIAPTEECDGLQLDSQSREDYWASIIEQGGSLWVYDVYDESECRQEAEYYGKKGINWVDTDYKTLRNQLVDIFGNVHTFGKFSVPAYKITMETLLKGLNSSTESARFIQKLFIEEEGDMWDAYNLMQIAVFGEIIYG